jgi:hypothetical protein
MRGEMKRCCAKSLEAIHVIPLHKAKQLLFKFCYDFALIYLCVSTVTDFYTLSSVLCILIKFYMVCCLYTKIVALAFFTAPHICRA